MPWLFLLLAVAAFAVALNTASMVLAVICLLAALGGTIAFVLGLLSQRVGSQTRDDSLLLDPAELRRLREEAEARRLAGAGAGAGAGASGASAGVTGPATGSPTGMGTGIGTGEPLSTHADRDPS
jgi:hypothetical protein